MPIGGEQAAVQNPFLRHAQEAGWILLTPDEALELRRGLTSPVLDRVLIEQLQTLNPGIVDRQKAEEIVAKLVRVRPTIEGNLDAWDFLKGLKTVFVEAEKRERNVRLLDPDPANLAANAFRYYHRHGPELLAITQIFSITHLVQFYYPKYWNEFVFKGYHHHQSDAIFLAGIPDLKATLPHA